MEENIYNLMEITNLPIDDARVLLEQNGFNLELALQNFYERNSASTTSTTTSNQANSQTNVATDEDEIRQPIPREYDVLVPEDHEMRAYRISRIRQHTSSFRDFKRESEIQEEELLNGASSAKRKCLEDIYRHPIDLIANIDFNYAKLQGQKYGKWIALLINNESLESLSLNRDIFNEPSQKAKQILKKNFIFLRKNSEDDEGIKLMQIYNLVGTSIPIFLICCSLTGELKKNFGDCTKLTLKTVVSELKKFSSTADKQLIYNSSYEDSDDDQIPPAFNYLTPSTSSVIPSQSKTETATTKKYIESDEESFASLNSNDVSDDDDKEENVEEPKVLDSDDEILKNDDADGPQTNILLRLKEENHKFRYPSNRSVANLINYIYRNYLIQTGIYDNKTKRFSLFSKIHNKCLTTLDQAKSLQDSNIHPSIVLLHNTLDKDD